MKSRIQIIDDNVALTTLLGKALSRFGYDPVVENNPLLAVNTVRHYMPDLILLDIMMPERDGGRVLQDLRNDLSLRYIPVILLTAIAREAQTLANTGGIQSVVIAKPVELKELLKVIESHLQAGKTYSQLQDSGPDGSPSQSHHSHSGMHELPNFDAEIPWAAEGTGGGAMMVNPSVTFDADFPARTGHSNGHDFSFPKRPEAEGSSGSAW